MNWKYLPEEGRRNQTWKFFSIAWAPLSGRDFFLFFFCFLIDQSWEEKETPGRNGFIAKGIAKKAMFIFDASGKELRAP